MDSAAPHADHAEVHRFLAAVNAAAAAAFAGADRPGMLQLVAIPSAGGRPIVLRHRIGDVDRQAEEAMRQAAAGLNVYIEGRTVAEGTSGRGAEAATRGVFAFVVDSDGDKGMAGRAGPTSSLVVETSPGNAHRWLFLSRALTADQAKPIGEALRAGIGADHDSGTITQPYRVAGTPNLVGPKKAARGRVPTPTRILEHSGRTYSADELRAAFPRQERAKADHAGPSGRSGRTSAEVEELVAGTGPDRSGRFHAAVVAALTAGLTPEDLEVLMRRHPNGCGGKYLDPYDRLRREIDRSWRKARARAEERRNGPAEPTYPDEAVPVDETRAAVEAAIGRFLEAAEAFQPDEEADPPVHAVAVSTGVGKTRITARLLARHIVAQRQAGTPLKPVLFLVPTHRLSREIENLFREHDIAARVFRGRQADDPARPGHPMCDDIEAVEIALGLGATISTSCCKGEDPRKQKVECPHFRSCAYQAQTEARPDVWIAAHQMLFQAQAALGKVSLVVIDEGFWQAGIRIPTRGLTLNEIAAPIPITTARQDYLINDVEVFRGKLSRALNAQVCLGGVERRVLVAGGLSADDCTAAIAAEWKLKGRATVWPGMPKTERRLAAKAAGEARHAKAFTNVWNAARGLLFMEEPDTVSGRLYLDARDDGEGRVILAKARSLKGIAKPWRVPTLILDATLPSLDVLRAFHPQVEVTARIETAMPHVRVRQVLDAPTGSGKLALGTDGTAGRNLVAVRRAILKRFVELGRAPLLVIAQKAPADWLRASGLPAGIAVEHFNAVAGLDHYRDVRGLMVIGRTVPSPVAVEALAGALTGLEPAKASPWYVKKVRGLRTRDGASVGIECDEHPDPIAEACRWQICEGELMQAIGRGRGVIRTAATPLSIDILANVCLPLTIDEAETWEASGEEVEMVAAGVVLDSAADMTAAWPGVWPTAGAARTWLWKHTRGEPSTVTKPYRDISYRGFGDSARRFRHQRPGNGQKWRTGAYDPAVVPDIQAWLTAKLGPLAGFEFLEKAAPQAADAPPAPAPPSHPPLLRAADYDPELAARFRLVVDIPAKLGPTAPVIPEIVRWRPPAANAYPGRPLAAWLVQFQHAAE